VRHRGHAGMITLVAAAIVLTGCGTGAGNAPGRSAAASTAGTAAPIGTATSYESSAGVPSPSVSVAPAAATPTTSAAAPSTTPAGEATPAPSFAPLSLAVIAVSGLRVRTAPSTSAAEVSGIHPVLGEPVLVVSGPVEAQGYRWYEVGFAQDPSNPAAAVPVGWIAAGTPTNPWLKPDPTSCPPPTVTSLASLAGIVRIGCYRSDAFTFDAHEAAEPADAGLGGACILPPSEPVWLACDVNYSWVNADGGTAWLVLLHFDPATGIQPTPLAPPGTVGPALRITGHYNDPAAHQCVTAPDAQSLDGLSQWLTCAQRLVVSQLRQTG
jgi:hypothetical protein